MNVIPMNLVDIQGSKKASPKNGKKLENKEIGKKRNLQEICNSGSSTPGKNTILQFLKESTNKRRKLDGNEISTQNSIKTHLSAPYRNARSAQRICALQPFPQSGGRACS